MRFDWDDAKARANLAKHGIAFDWAIRVFDDPDVMSEVDRIVDGEARWRTVGRVGFSTILFVGHTWVDDDGEIYVRVITRRGRRADMKSRDMKPETRDISAELAVIDAMSDDDIDFSDAPEITDFSGFRRGVSYRAEKQAVTIRLDSDVVAWFKASEPKYQTAVNRVLREYMTAHLKSA